MPVPEKYAMAEMRGDSFGRTFTLWEDDAHTIPVVLNGAAVTAQLRVKDTDPDPVDAWAVTTAGNAITITLSPDQSAVLPASTVWDIQVDWQADGTTVTTPVRGSLKLTQDVTRA